MSNHVGISHICVRLPKIFAWKGERRNKVSVEIKRERDYSNKEKCKDD